jgi:hypothetical protein
VSALVLLVCVALLIGCGGNGDETAVRRAVERWNAAVLDHDGRAACAELSTRLRKSIERHLLGEGVGGDCRTWAARYVSPRHPATHRGLRITAVKIDGERATVHLSARGAVDSDARLVDERGRWRIDDY